VKKGHNLKNICRRVMVLVGNDVDFDGEYILMEKSLASWEKLDPQIKSL
jgi:hypothetical protein